VSQIIANMFPLS